MDKATAERMVDNHAKKVLEYNSPEGKFIFGELQDARAALIAALTETTRQGHPTDSDNMHPPYCPWCQTLTH